MDGGENAVIVWYQSNGTRQQTFKSEYIDGSWAYPSSVTDNISPDGQNATSSKVAMDNYGKAIITLQQSDGTDRQIFNSTYGGWIVDVSVGSNGSVSPSASQVVGNSSTTSFTVTPDSDYDIALVTGCSGDDSYIVGNTSASTYTTGSITSNCTVSAYFGVTPIPTMNALGVVLFMMFSGAALYYFRKKIWL